MKSLFSIIKIILIINLLSSCASIPGGNIKLENYPDIEKENIKDVNLNYEKEEFQPDKKGLSFTHEITSRIDKKLENTNKKNNKINTTNCSLKISTMHSAPFPRLCIANYFIAGFTLFTIPYYCQHIFEAKATLTDNKTGTILKSYYFKDKAHEVWSILWLITP
jgi:hypothetical protein